ncbi:kelch-like protein 2 [Metopolophium dirhodum]|uniref:kelch-like protein 2 n=1 Tax=Metopolophium dirhodum TaxID=44670 RepID=UPI0029904AB1|nr:kelch-like protein 2 [Metopolophium dirhodum]
MTELRAGAGVTVLNNVIMYAVGGFNSTITHNSVEAYTSSTLQWTSAAPMNYTRKIADIVAFNGLLNDSYKDLKSMEQYNPDTNTWSVDRIRAGLYTIHTRYSSN